MRIRAEIDDNGDQILPPIPEGWYLVTGIDGWVEAAVPYAQLAEMGGHISALAAMKGASDWSYKCATGNP